MSVLTASRAPTKSSKVRLVASATPIASAGTRAAAKMPSTFLRYDSRTWRTAPGCSLKSSSRASPSGSFATRPRPPVIAISASVTARPPSDRSW